jgi:signal transduction histidine kinase
MLKALKIRIQSVPLTVKLIVIILALNLAMLAVLFLLYTNLTEDLVEKVEGHTEDLTKAIQISVKKLATQEYTDTYALTEYLNSLNSKGIGEINIVNTDQEIIASTNPKKIGRIFQRDRQKNKVMITAQIGEETDKVVQKHYNLIFPVAIGNELFGYVHLSMLLDDFTNLVRQSYIERLIATSIVFSIGILLAIFLARRYTRPIHLLVEAAQKVASGDLGQTIKTDRTDEIGSLMNNFNDMIVKLRAQKELKEKLSRAEHLSKIGKLASGIAHEIKNPLNFISLSIDHLREKYAPYEERQKQRFEDLMDNIKDEIHRLKKLIEDFLNYGKPLKLNQQWFDAGKLLDDTLNLVSAKAEDQFIEIKKSMIINQKLYGDPELIKTCFVNVILNAFQVMPTGGTLTIETFQTDNVMTFTFKDTGPGITDTDLSKVFEPYFTTKDVGLGLGLYMTKQIVGKHKGSIYLKKAPGGGTVVTIIFPLVPNESESYDYDYSKK